MKIKYLAVLAAIFSSSMAFANENAAAIDAACAADAKTAGCADKKVGSGLLTCLHDYKKAHKEFALSAGCKEQIEHKKADMAAKKADNEAINTACAADAKTAGCADKKVGGGLLRCLHDYKKEHKDFALSAGCKTAVEKRHDDQKQHGDHKPAPEKKSQ